MVGNDHGEIAVPTPERLAAISHVPDTITVPPHPNITYAMTAATRKKPIRKTKATTKSRGRSRPENSTPIFSFQDWSGFPPGGFGLATACKLAIVRRTEGRLCEVSFAC